MESSQWGYLIGLMASVGASVWSLAWWLNGHFTDIRKEITTLGRSIQDKLEYHERHDDARFNQVRDDIWEIRVRNAATDGLIKPLIKTDVI